MVNQTQIIGVSFTHTLLAIFAFVYVFDTYAPNFQEDGQFEHNPFYWFCIWATISLLPIAQIILFKVFNVLLFSWEDLNEYVTIGSFAMWIWGFVIVGSDDWDTLRTNYDKLYKLGICYQVFFVMFAIFTLYSTDSESRSGSSVV